MGLDDTIEVIAARWPLFAATGATLIGVGVARHLYRWHVLSSIPMIGEELGGQDKRKAAYATGAKQMYEDGYNKVGNLDFARTHTPRSRLLTFARAAVQEWSLQDNFQQGRDVHRRVPQVPRRASEAPGRCHQL